MIEKELKVILTQEQYECLRGRFRWNEIRLQKNHYYVDVHNRMKSEDITVRARECKGKIYLQVKMPIQNEGPVHVKKEFEALLDSIPDEISGEFLTSLCTAEFPTVRRIGDLTTERCIFKWDEHTEVCLDKNSYWNMVDYEIEVEYQGELDEAILNLFAENNIKIENHVEGKCRRFFNIYDNMCEEDKG